MQTDCLHCANWRISEKRKDGKTYLIAMAEHHYGLCRHFEVWTYSENPMFAENFRRPPAWRSRNGKRR